MNLFTVSILAFALGTDAFAVSVGMGLQGVRGRDALKLVGGFGFFQFLMPMIGMQFAVLVTSFAGSLTEVFGGVLLLALGLKGIYDSLKNDKSFSGGATSPDSSVTPMRAAALSLAVSIDALSVGFSLGAITGRFILASIIIGFTASLMTSVGLFLGRTLGTILEKPAEILGGLILTAVGLTILLS